MTSASNEFWEEKGDDDASVKHDHAFMLQNKDTNILARFLRLISSINQKTPQTVTRERERLWKGKNQMASGKKYSSPSCILNFLKLMFYNEKTFHIYPFSLSYHFLFFLFLLHYLLY
ncbi:hypothetical protein E2542_SST10006 [Spatholobus suberectus]|nr:hypothetical protein E2542_SST10006 [Spatholobus suberectus]